MARLQVKYKKLHLPRFGCVNIECRFICVNSFNLSYHLGEILKETNCSSIDNLQIEEGLFENTTLNTNYFTINHTIHELSIFDSSLMHITNEVFNKEIFTNTFTLIIKTPKLKCLLSGMLLGMTKLEYLIITSAIEDISRVFLQPVRSSLKHLQINGMTEKVKFEHIFGISVMTNLYHLDASENYFYEPIKKSTFQLLPKLQYLNLAQSHIQVIEENAFEPVWMTLKFLDISQNNLLIIYDLSSVFEVKPIYIHVRDNDWNCSCKLLPFVKVFRDYRDYFLDTPYCRYPQIYYGHAINVFKYNCKVNTTTEEIKSSTTSRFTTTRTVRTTVDPTKTSFGMAEKTSPIETESEELELTTPKSIFSTFKPLSTTSSTVKPDDVQLTTQSPLPENIVLLECLQHEESNFMVHVPSNNDIVSLPIPNESHMFVESLNYDFNIQFNSPKSALVTIHKSDSTSDLIDLIWFSEPSDLCMKSVFSENDSVDFGCVEPVERKNKSIIIENLKESTTYTICLIKHGHTEVRPFDCLPFHTEEFGIDPANDYLSNDDNAFIIAVICLVVTIAASLGGAISFFVIKSYPNILKGSKKVLIVKKSKTVSPNTVSNPNSINTRCLKRTSVEKNSEISNLSASPFFISHKDHDVDSAYETPVNSDVDSHVSIYCDSHNSNLELPKFCDDKFENLPPPLPKRNSEHIYGTIRSPILQAKRSI